MHCKELKTLEKQINKVLSEIVEKECPSSYKGYFNDNEIAAIIRNAQQKFLIDLSFGIETIKRADNANEIIDALKKIRECPDFKDVIKNVQQNKDKDKESQYFDVEWMIGALANYMYFLSSEILNAANQNSCSSEIDALWHAHQQFNNRYMRFCQDIYSQKLSHLPTDKQNKGQAIFIRTIYNNTRDVILKYFGANGNDVYWDAGAAPCCSDYQPNAGDFIIWEWSKKTIEAPNKKVVKKCVPLLQTLYPSEIIGGIRKVRIQIDEVPKIMK